MTTAHVPSAKDLKAELEAHQCEIAEARAALGRAVLRGRDKDVTSSRARLATASERALRVEAALEVVEAFAAEAAKEAEHQEAADRARRVERLREWIEQARSAARLLDRAAKGEEINPLAANRIATQGFLHGSKSRGLTPEWAEILRDDALAAAAAREALIEELSAS